MSERCATCLYEPMLGRFCPECGTERAPSRFPRSVNAGDPFVGRVVAGRYEVGELISVGGMGRVHRGVQRSLDRAIAIKFIHPHLLTSPDAVSRFMTEARTASRLNHPNVVSIFDFGRTAPNEGNDLFIVMELLTGSDLATLATREYPLAIPRVVDITRQTLLALAEAHAAGITHRDVKPENVFVTPHAETDHVKVIDFGLASVHAARRITRDGHAMGTPAFMAPEQIRGQLAGPPADQYATGVMLFELLTGSLPFDDGSPLAVMQQHLTAPRPDPRSFAPDRAIPEALANVCKRAMAVDPAKRFADAREMCRALVASVVRAAPHAIARVTAPLASVPPPKRTERFETMPAEAPQRVPAVSDGRPARDVWRAKDLERIRAAIVADDTRHGAILVGRPGVGCSYLANAAAETIDDAVVLRVNIPDAPRCRVRRSGLRRIVRSLSAFAADRETHVGSARHDAFDIDSLFADDANAGREADDGALLASTFDRLTLDVGAPVLVIIDDVDRMDALSLRALRDFATTTPRRSLRLVLTCERVPAGLEAHFATFPIQGLSRADAETRLGRSRAASSLVRDDDDIEPLYIEQLARWVRSADAPAPTALADLLEARIQSLGAQERLALQSLALTGGGTLEESAGALRDTTELQRALPALEAEGFVVRSGGEIRIAHTLMARVVLSITPNGALESLHALAADHADDRDAPIELRLHHALRGRGDLGAFLLAERAAARCVADGDTDAAIAVLADALHTARLRLAHGESEAAESAATVFARKLAELLLREGRSDEARGVVAEALSACDPSSPARTPLLELLKDVSRQRRLPEPAATRGFEVSSWRAPAPSANPPRR